MTILPFLMLFMNGCSQKAPCPPVKYPSLEAVQKIPHIRIVVSGGMMDVNSTKKAFKTIKALRVSENYYSGLINQYRKDFVR